MKELFSPKISKVVVSQRVEKTPSIIVTSAFGHTANMERIMKAQSMSSDNAARGMQAQRTLELNPRHPLIVELNKRVQNDKKDDKLKDLSYLVYDTALLASGFSQDDIEGNTNTIILLLLTVNRYLNRLSVSGTVILTVYRYPDRFNRYLNPDSLTLTSLILTSLILTPLILTPLILTPLILTSLILTLLILILILLGFSDRMYRTIASSLSLSSLELEPELEINDDDDDEEEKKDDKKDDDHDEL